MKKLIYLFFFLVSFCVFAQKITEQQAETSTDLKVVAGFIKQNPNHPRTDEFKRKLIAIMNSDKTPEQQSKIAKPEVKPLDKEKLKTEVKTASTNTSSTTATKATTTKSTPTKSTETSEKNKRTADLLTHMFSNDPNSKEAYVQIINKSKCNLIVKISGKKFYNLTVPANNQNFILIDKGNYNLTSSICDAKYNASKNIKGDIAITLNAPVMTKGK